jgi:putative ABC transport system permease protein
MMRNGSARRQWRRIFRRDPGSEVGEELDFHLEQRIRDYIERGMDPEAARLAAHERMGDVERARIEGAALLSGGRRTEERRTLLRISWLDVKLGARMLVKYPVLSIVGGLGMAVAIAIGAALFDAAALIDPPLPFDDGDRIVAIENWDTEWSDQERRILHDFVLWRDELRSVDELGAYRTVAHNLIVPGGETVLVFPAEMTASGFTVTRVPALLGRGLLPEDERAAAPPVVVIGYDVWRTRFASDPAVVGREVRLGTTVHTVVGVMPEGFAFPLNHEAWIPFRERATERRQGPAIRVFGRLGEAATLEGAQAELAAIGARMASAFPETHERLRPRIMPYTMQIFDGMDRRVVYAVQLPLLLLLGVVCVNVAILVYARTATRQSEIAVRTALGASRRRIVGQLFAEALVFAGAAAVVGVFVARLALGAVETMLSSQALPFWIEFDLSTGSLVYVIALTVLSALIVGVLPALQATGASVRSRLQLRGGGAMHLGKIWTTLVVVQVAISVIVLPGAAYYTWTFMKFGTADPGYRTEEYLSAWLSFEGDSPWSGGVDVVDSAFDARFAAVQRQLVDRLRAEPEVSAAVLTMGPPGEEGAVWLEIEGVAPSSATAEAVRAGGGGFRTGTDRVSAGFFEAFDVPLLAGRTFNAADTTDGATAVIVNRSFVERLGAGNVVGRRVRYGGASGDVAAGQIEMDPWFEIVGVVADFPNRLDPGVPAAKIYRPAGAAAVHGMVHVRVRGGSPTSFARRLRALAATLDPRLQVRSMQPLDVMIREEQRAMQLGALGIAAVTLSVLLLSAAGIYAMMSFALSQRRREIGIRAALGAHPRRLLGAIFTRALAQLSIGVAVGLLLTALVDVAAGGEMMGGNRAVLLPGVAAFMLAVGLLAAIGPARRGLAVQPTDVLREE